MADQNLDTVLVLGGSGFLGSHIIQRLLSGEHATKVVCASRNPKTGDDRIEYHGVDISSKDSVVSLFEKVRPQVVIHTVSPHHLAPAAELEAANVGGTRNILDAARACQNTIALVYTSTDSACHSSPFKQITEDESKLYNATVFANQYSKTKALAEAEVTAANSPELKTAALRIPVVYGERDTNFMPQIFASIRRGEHKNQLGPDTKMFEFLYVQSAAEAHILAAKALVQSAPGADGQAYFITDGEPSPFFGFLRKCYAAAGHPVEKHEVKVVPLWVVQTIASVGEWVYWIFTAGHRRFKLSREEIDRLDSGCWWSIEKARRLLAYEPVMAQDEAIKRSVEWGKVTFK